MKISGVLVQANRIYFFVLLFFIFSITVLFDTEATWGTDFSLPTPHYTQGENGGFDYTNHLNERIKSQGAELLPHLRQEGKKDGYILT